MRTLMLGMVFPQGESGTEMPHGCRRPEAGRRLRSCAALCSMSPGFDASSDAQSIKESSFPLGVQRCVGVSSRRRVLGALRRRNRSRSSWRAGALPWPPSTAPTAAVTTRPSTAIPWTSRPSCAEEVAEDSHRLDGEHGRELAEEGERHHVEAPPRRRRASSTARSTPHPRSWRAWTSPPTAIATASTAASGGAWPPPRRRSATLPASAAASSPEATASTTASATAEEVASVEPTVSRRTTASAPRRRRRAGGRWPRQLSRRQP